jgi:hypothetical protein
MSITLEEVKQSFTGKRFQTDWYRFIRLPNGNLSARPQHISEQWVKPTAQSTDEAYYYCVRGHRNVSFYEEMPVQMKIADLNRWYSHRGRNPFSSHAERGWWQMRKLAGNDAPSGHLLENLVEKPIPDLPEGGEILVVYWSQRKRAFSLERPADARPIRETPKRFIDVAERFVIEHNSDGISHREK